MTAVQPLWFRIGEVAEAVGVKPHVIRYWESEFKRWIRPERSRSGQRVYSRHHVERLSQIRDLLYVERYTIEGARRRLSVESQELGVAHG
jgi:DNA-binding transcriptional MerR regulator